QSRSRRLWGRDGNRRSVAGDSLQVERQSRLERRVPMGSSVCCARLFRVALDCPLVAFTPGGAAALGAKSKRLAGPAYRSLCCYGGNVVFRLGNGIFYQRE